MGPIIDDEQNTVQPEIKPLSWKWWEKRRYIVVFLVFIGYVILYTFRSSLSISLMAMTANRTNYHENGTTSIGQQFSWGPEQKGLILSAFFYGYVSTPIFGGLLGARFGYNFIFSTSTGLTCLLTLLTPWIASMGFYYFMALRALMGIFEGVANPAVFGIWSKWAPPLERTRILSFSYAGSHLGYILSMSLSGLIAENCGWESIFYIFGSIGSVWYLFYVFIVKESPDQDKYISEDELRYINESIGALRQPKISTVPWKAMFTSDKVYAIYIVHFAETWGIVTFMTHLPVFLSDIFSFNLSSSGLLSAAPYVAVLILTPISGYLADMCIIRKYLTVTQTRKLFTCTPCILQPIFLVLSAYILDPIFSVSCLILSLAIGAFSGFAVNFFDLAPQYAGILLGIGNMIGNISGIVSPIITGYIVQNKAIEEWRIVFFIAAGIYLTSCAVYYFLCSGELQSWAKPIPNETEMKNKLKNDENKFHKVNNGFEDDKTV